MNNFFEAVKKYLEETPQEKVLEDWQKSAYSDDGTGPSVENFLRVHQSFHIVSISPDQIIQNKLIINFDPEFSSGFLCRIMYCKLSFQ